MSAARTCTSGGGGGGGWWCRAGERARPLLCGGRGGGFLCWRLVSCRPVAEACESSGAGRMGTALAGVSVGVTTDATSRSLNVSAGARMDECLLSHPRGQPKPKPRRALLLPRLATGFACVITTCTAREIWGDFRGKYRVRLPGFYSSALEHGRVLISESITSRLLLFVLADRA